MLIIDSYPILRYFLPAYYSYLSNGYAIQNFFLKEIEKHIEKFDSEKESDNFIDAYLKEMFLQNNKTFSLVFFNFFRKIY